MNAPKRWLDDTEDSGAQDLLRAGISVEPPPGAQDDVWASLVARIPPPGGPPGHPPGGGSGAAAGKAAAVKAGAAAVSGGLIKSALIGAGSAVVLLAGYTAVTPSTSSTSSTPDRPEPPPAVSAAPDRPEPLPISTAPVRAAPPPTAVVSAEPSSEPSARPVVVEPHPIAATAPAPSVEPALRESMLREESRMVADARAALRRGDAGGALSMLEQIRAKFPGGVLVQEREALSIEALARSGRKADAAARAAAFVKAYPTSPLAARAQQFAN